MHPAEGLASKYRLMGNSVMMRCLFHNDKSPSMGVVVKRCKMPLGYYHCFGCGAKGPWSDIAAKLGLPLDEEGGVTGLGGREVSKFREYSNLDELVNNEWGLTLRELPDEWRGFSSTFLAKVGAVGTRNSSIVLPCTVNNELKGAILCAAKKTKSSYLNSKGPWVQASGLLGYDSKAKGAAVLVEGPRDYLRLRRAGIYSLGILGTHNWSEAKRDLVLLQDRKVLCLMDGDDAGDAATKIIRASLSCKVLRLRRGEDPFSMSVSALKKLKEMCHA